MFVLSVLPLCQWLSNTAVLIPLSDRELRFGPVVLPLVGWTGRSDREGFVKGFICECKELWRLPWLLCRGDYGHRATVNADRLELQYEGIPFGFYRLFSHNFFLK